MKKKGIKSFIVALASVLMLVCIVAAAPDSTLRFIDPTPANYTQEQDFTCGVLAVEFGIKVGHSAIPYSY